jgi:hypothetical protein
MICAACGREVEHSVVSFGGLVFTCGKSSTFEWTGHEEHANRPVPAMEEVRRRLKDALF